MPYDVFISYSKPDKTTADAVCGTLEAQGVRCWIAPRDVEPGRDWSESIVDALNHVPVMVLVFSSHANGSPQVRREVQRAFEKNITVIPFRVENVMPVQSLEYYIGPVHWLDALTPPLDTFLQQLCRTVKRLLAGHSPAEERPAARTETAPPPIPAFESHPPRATEREHAARSASAKVAPPEFAPPPPSAQRAATSGTAEPKRRSPLVALGFCAILGLTICGVVYLWKTQEPKHTATIDKTETEKREGELAFPFSELKIIPPGGETELRRNGNPVVSTRDGITIVTTTLSDAETGTDLHAMIPRQGAPKPGESWSVPDLRLELEFIRPGRFTMGSASNERNRQANEGPPTTVTISKGFWLASYEVTRSQWLELMPRPPKGNKDADEDAPLDTVTWDDAIEFCQILMARESVGGRVPPGYEYTLPTEAQWEYACRAGTTTPFSFGERLTSEMANFDGSQTNGSDAAGGFRTGSTSIGMFEPNTWRLFDMHGNLAEWTLGFYSRNLPGGSVTDYAGPPAGRTRVVRGGSWHDAGWACRSAARVEVPANSATDTIGFRVALVPER